MGTSSQIGYLRDMIKCKLFFANNFERTGVWSAFCYCTFEEGPAIYCGRCPRSTQKMHIRELEYGLHFATVPSRRDPQCGRCPRSTQKMHIRELEYAPHRTEVHKNALLLVYSL